MPDTFYDRSRDTGVPEAGTTGRALVPLTLPSPKVPAALGAARPDARFVAHLIATATHAPQTRLLRRAAADDAVETYAAGARDNPALPANGLSLSLVA